MAKLVYVGAAMLADSAQIRTRPPFVFELVPVFQQHPGLVARDGVAPLQVADEFVGGSGDGGRSIDSFYG
jgi:hypothetical protein